MSIYDLFGVIEAEALKAVAQHWNQARGNKTLPAWHDIQPAAISGQLKLIWVYKYDCATELFTGRLAGNSIEAVFGKSFRGTAMTDLYRPEDYDRLHARAKRVVCEPAFFRSDGKVFQHFERIGHGERIMLPLSDDGRSGDGILGATVYELATGAPSALTTENERWFSL